MKKSKTKIRKFFDFFQLSQTEDIIKDQEHPHRRRFLPQYQNRLRYVRDYWLYYLLAILIFQISLPFFIATFLLNTFLSFAFLDETPFPDLADD